MNKKLLSLATAILAAATSGTFVAHAQSEAPPKPSPYTGVSQPPPSDVITTTEEEPVPAPKPAPKPATAPAPATATSNPVPATPTNANASTNPDAGIVETPLPPPSGEANTTTPATLHTRIYNPDADIVTEVPSPPNTLPEGTLLKARLMQEVSAEDTTPGTPFRAQLTQNVIRDGRIVIPIGSEIHGKVTYVKAGRRISGRSVIRLRPDEILLPDGTHYLVHAGVVDTQGSNTAANDEGEVVSKDHGKRTAAEFAIGSGGGALVGGALAGPAGAIAGTAIGAGVVTTHWLRESHAAILPAESIVVFSLNNPVPLTPAHN